jgi:hypothetical protein
VDVLLFPIVSFLSSRSVPLQILCGSQVMYRTCNTDGLEGTESHDAISCDSASFADSIGILLLGFSTRRVACGKVATNGLTGLGCSQGTPPATFFEIYACLLQLRTEIASRHPISSTSFLAPMSTQPAMSLMAKIRGAIHGFFQSLAKRTTFEHCALYYIL